MARLGTLAWVGLTLSGCASSTTIPAAVTPASGDLSREAFSLVVATLLADRQISAIVVERYDSPPAPLFGRTILSGAVVPPEWSESDRQRAISALDDISRTSIRWEMIQDVVAAAGITPLDPDSVPPPAPEAARDRSGQFPLRLRLFGVGFDADSTTAAFFRSIGVGDCVHTVRFSSSIATTTPRGSYGGATNGGCPDHRLTGKWT